MDEYSQYREQTAAAEALQKLHKAVPNDVNTESKSWSNTSGDQPPSESSASRFKDQEPSSNPGVNEVVDNLNCSKLRNSNDTAAKNRKILNDTYDKSADPLREVRNRLDEDIKASVKQSSNVFERMWHYKRVPMISSEVRDKFASYIPPESFSGYQRQLQGTKDFSDVLKAPAYIVAGYPRTSIVNRPEYVTGIGNTMEKASTKQYYNLVLDDQKNNFSSTLPVHTVCNHLKVKCGDVSEIDVAEDIMSKSGGKVINGAHVYGRSSMIVPFKSISQSKEDSDGQSRSNEESCESLSINQEDAESIISSTDSQNQSVSGNENQSIGGNENKSVSCNENQFVSCNENQSISCDENQSVSCKENQSISCNENIDLNLVEHEAECDIIDNNIDLHRDTIDTCSETDKVLRENCCSSNWSETGMVDTSNCLETGRVMGERFHTGKCSETNIVADTGNCSETDIAVGESSHTRSSETGIAVGESSHTRNCSETGIEVRESSHTRNCSDTGIVVGESSHTRNCSETGIEVRESSHTRNCSDTGIVADTGSCSETDKVVEEGYHTCGGCGQKFDHICKLHQHLIGHSSGGSYHYDNYIRTAFPKYGMVCKEMQTEEFSIPHASKRRKRKEVIDDCDVPLLQKVRKVSKQKDNKKIGVRSKKRNNSNTSGLEVKVGVNDNKRIIKNLGEFTMDMEQPVLKHRPENMTANTKKNESGYWTETEIGGSKRKIENSQTRKKCNVSRLHTQTTTTTPSRTPSSDMIEEKIEFGKETIDYSVNCNISDTTNDRIQVDLEDNSDDEEEEDNGDITCILEQNFQNTVQDDFHTEDEANSMTYDINKVKVEIPVFQETDGKRKEEETYWQIDKDSNDVNATVKPETRTVYEKTGKDNNKKINVVKIHVVDTFQCKICDQEFCKKLKMQQHIKEVHKYVRFICRICSATFDSNADLRTHRKAEHTVVTHTCGLCGKVLSTKAMLEGHYLVHMGIKPFACDICVPKREFTRKSQLQAHMQTHSSEKNLQCEFCGKPFNARYLMINHVKHCGGIKPHHCDDCDMRFVSNHCLQRHRRIHTGEKPYVCEVCAFASSNPSCLKRHMRTHTGEKPFKCPHCQQTFAAPGALKKHIRIHTKEKPYACSFCSKAFTQRWNLKTHERQHTGETPYKCTMCGLGFKQNVLLKTHVKSHCNIGHQRTVFQHESSVPLQLSSVQGTIIPVVHKTEQFALND